MNPSEVYLEDEQAQIAFGGCLAVALADRTGLVTLQGDLGTGKTTLVRGLLRELGHEGPVRSPTYTLIESYAAAGRTLHHLDLYRLADPEELEYLGWRELIADDALVLVEWPERGEGVLPPADLQIAIAHAPPGRVLRMLASSGWQQELGQALATFANRHRQRG